MKSEYTLKNSDIVDNNKVVNSWWSKNGHKVDPVLQVGDTVPLFDQ